MRCMWKSFQLWHLIVHVDHMNLTWFNRKSFFQKINIEYNFLWQFFSICLYLKQKSVQIHCWKVLYCLGMILLVHSFLFKWLKINYSFYQGQQSAKKSTDFGLKILYFKYEKLYLENQAMNKQDSHSEPTYIQLYIQEYSFSKEIFLKWIVFHFIFVLFFIYLRIFSKCM